MQETTQKVANFLEAPKQLLINGKWQSAASGEKFVVENPATADKLAEVAKGTNEDVQLAIDAARNAFDNGPWTKMTASQRANLMFKLADLLEANLDEFAYLESLDNGKPYAVAKAADVPLAVEQIRYYAGWATKIEGSTFPISVPYTPDTRYLSYTLKEPVGVVAQIIPWNFPLLMAAWKLGPALAAGCSVILKPAEQTPLTAIRLGELICEAGFPEGVVNVVTGFGDAGAALAESPRVDKVAFTGSTEVGKSIVKAAAGNLKKVSLELGGKSPNIIFEDADIETAIQGAASAIFFNHGQCCCAGSRLFIHESIFDKVVEGVAAIANDIKLGSGLDEATQMGPLVSDEQMQRVTGFIQSGISEGANVVCGGVQEGEQGYFVKPTLLTNTSNDMKVIKEEIFGPVVAAIPFSGFDEVIEAANDSSFGLAAGIWTQDISKAHKASAALKAGTTWINCYNIFDAALPFGGYKESGWGREMGQQALSLYLETKSVCLPV